MILLVSLVLPLAVARPDDGGDIFNFDDSDTLVSLDSPEGRVRVWYSVSGPNVTLLDDEDADGVPDFPAAVAANAEAVLDFYEGLGLRAPLSDGTTGGSAAMDAYLVDFAGIGDGQFSSERCSDVDGALQCSGYFVMENDFAGYGYGDLDHAVRTLTSHELFHAVQAAYDAGEESWWSEGTATWGEWAFDPGNTDFLYLCDAYLEDPSRSLDQPPSGTTAFAYGTALWWYFLTNRYGDSLMGELLLATEANGDGDGAPLTAAMSALIESHGGTLWDDWFSFGQWNLATSSRAGAMESYSFAASIGPPVAEARDPSWADEYRFYPLATTYVEVQHPGGALQFVLGEAAPSLRFSLHPINDSGKVLDPLDSWEGEAGVRELGELAEGNYWLVASNPTLDEDSTKVWACIGDAEAVRPCLDVLAEGEGDSGAGDSGAGDSGEPAINPVKEQGCGCESGTGQAGWALLLLGLGWGARRGVRSWPREDTPTR